MKVATILYYHAWKSKGVTLLGSRMVSCTCLLLCGCHSASAGRSIYVYAYVCWHRSTLLWHVGLKVKRSSYRPKDSHIGRSQVRQSFLRDPEYYPSLSIGLASSGSTRNLLRGRPLSQLAAARLEPVGGNERVGASQRNHSGTSSSSSPGKHPGG